MSSQCTFDDLLAFVVARMNELYDHTSPSYSPPLHALYKATVLVAIEKRRSGDTTGGLALLLFTAQRWKSHPDFDIGWTREGAVETQRPSGEPRKP